jgi:diguanylate cyclase (GGDEF)-like protein
LDGITIYTITKLSIVPGYEDTWERVLFSNLDITERKLAQERLEFISLHDLMTGVYNRAFFEEELARFEKSRNYPISILVADMDNLKRINDVHGHAAGDLALQQMASVIKGCFREDDVIARIGGDEFAVLLPGVKEECALKSIDRIQAAVEENNQDLDPDAAIAISIGTATAEQGDGLVECLEKADEAMYS